MSTIKMGSFNEAEEELRAIGSWASIGHGKDTTSSVLQREVLVCELASVDGRAASAIVSSEITTLSHEVRDDSVECAALVVEWHAICSISFLASAESTEILRGYGSVVIKINRDSACTLAANGNVKEDFAVNTRSSHIFRFLILF